MTSASIDFELPHVEVDIWLPVGKEGREFTYADNRGLGLDLGDLVRVHLRGRPMNGLVIARRTSKSINYLNKDETFERKVLSGVDELIQKAAVDKEWRLWLEEVAVSCHISPFRMLKAALPPGWLGQRNLRKQSLQDLWWVYLVDISFDENLLTRRQAELIELLKNSGGGLWQKNIYKSGFSSVILQNLIAQGFANREKRKKDLDYDKKDKPLTCSSLKLENPSQLTCEQLDAVTTYGDLNPGDKLLIWGVTGSGKTEVYMHIASKELALGKSCLILTPEIGLIPQLVDRFKKRFGPRVHEYHSGCSDAERVRTWREILATKEPLLLIGTRSAVFLPLSTLGLIVLDEEHDSSYKQESPMPCYHAREIAFSRAVKTGARVVLGSATPSLSTWKELSPKGSIALARLEHRISNNPLPGVSVIDMRQELSCGNRGLISRTLMQHLAGLPEAGEQAVVLVPRRGFSSFLSCRSCGEVVECPNCDVALTVHRDGDGREWLRCHWCDYRSNVGTHCSECGSNAFKPFGAGTQRVMDYLTKELEGVKLLRFDRDTTRGRDGHRKLLERFASGEADVLVGTQMLAKGMDLPRVTLAAVLAADGLLHRPDLFAKEQSLQLLMQLAGRAGRGERPGKLIVQTYCPEHPVIKHLVDGRYEEFLRKESLLRKEASLVPFSRACLLRLSGESASCTATAAAALAERIKPLCITQGWSVLGPAPSLIARIAGRSRWQLLLHGPEGSTLPFAEGFDLWSGIPRGVNLSVDPDPLQL